MSATATPFLLASIGVNSAAGLIGSRTQAAAIRQEGDYAQQQFEANVRLADIQAEDARSRGTREASRIIGRGRRIQGKQRAGYAGQGVDVNVGTPATVVQETGATSEMDALTTANNAYREAWGYETQANNLRWQGRIAKRAADNEARNTIMSGGLRFAQDLTTGAYLYSQGTNTSKGRGPTEAKFSKEYAARGITPRKWSMRWGYR